MSERDLLYQKQKGPDEAEKGASGTGDTQLSEEATLFINVAVLAVLVGLVLWRVWGGWFPQLWGKAGGGGEAAARAAPAAVASADDGHSAALREARRAQMEALHAQQREQQRAAREKAAEERMKQREELERDWVGGGRRVGLGPEGYVPPVGDESPSAPVGSQRSLLPSPVERAEVRSAHTQHLRHRRAGGGSEGSAERGDAAAAKRADAEVAAALEREEREAEERASLALAERLLSQEEEAEPAVVAATAATAGDAEEGRRQIRAEQDRAYHDSLAKDRARQDEAEQARRRVQGARERFPQRRPSDGAGGEAWSLRVRLGAGHGLQIEQTFAADAPLQELVDWVCLETEGAAERPAGFPASLHAMELVVANPRKRVCAFAGAADGAVGLDTPLRLVPGLRNRTILLLRPHDT